MFGKSKNEIRVQVEQLPDNYEDKEFSLVEIKDDTVISKIKSAVPELAAIIANSGVAVQGAQLANAGVYQAILPVGKELANSTDMQNAVRGFFRQGKGIGGQANFLRADGTVDKIASVNMANAIMGTAALVVGQYYMTQINFELMVMKESISRISDFKAEILENNTLRNEEIHRLQSLETTCMELLNQANVTVSDLGGRECISFDQYEKMMSEASAWQKYQVSLTEMLFMIADLNYTLHLGALSKEQCYLAYTDLYDTTDKMINKLKRWHEIHRKKFHIDVDQARMERQGIDAIIHKPLGIINSNFNYKNIGKSTVVNIRQQKNMQVVNRTLDMRDRFNEDICIVAKDGKVYYRVE